MNFAPLARIIVTIFGVLGLGIQARVLLSTKWSDIAPLWEIASLPQKLGMAGVLAVPVCFYTFCILTCFVRLPKPALLTCTGIVALTAVPFFLGMRDEYPTIARNAMWTGFPWLFVFADQLYAKPKQSSDIATDVAQQKEQKRRKPAGRPRDRI